MKSRYQKIKAKISFWEQKLVEIKKEHTDKSIELNKYIDRHPSLSFAGLETTDAEKLKKIYAYFDKKYAIYFQSGLRCDTRRMKLVFWLNDDPDYLIIHLCSTSQNIQNIWFSGTTSWIVKAETLQDKTKALKQIKKDIQKIIK